MNKNKRICDVRFISLEEQKEAEQYVLNKPLERPNVKWYTVLFWIIIQNIIAWLILLITSIFSTSIILWIAIYLSVVLLSLRFVLIKVVQCYQHYASEERRRKCLCKPTCSEYAILCLKKYNLVKAIIKIYIRLTKTCKGELYKIDNP